MKLLGLRALWKRISDEFAWLGQAAANLPSTTDPNPGSTQKQTPEKSADTPDQILSRAADIKLFYDLFGRIFTTCEREQLLALEATIRGEFIRMRDQEKFDGVDLGEIYCWLGYTCHQLSFRLGDREQELSTEAMEHWQTALTLYEQLPIAQRWQAGNHASNMAATFEERGDLDGALVLMRKAFRYTWDSSPITTPALYLSFAHGQRLIELLLKTNRLGEALSIDVQLLTLSVWVPMSTLSPSTIDQQILFFQQHIALLNALKEQKN